MMRLTRILSLAAATAACAVPAARAQQANDMAGIGINQTITARATVQSVSVPNREITLIGPTGSHFTVTAGPEVVNFSQISPGDLVVARYHESVVYVLSAPGGTLPQPSLTSQSSGAPQGAAPSGSVSAKLVVTGVVVGIDPTTHTLQLVAPDGGAVTSAHVTDPQVLRGFDAIKLGDSITAILSAALAVSIEPAP